MKNKIIIVLVSILIISCNKGKNEKAKIIGETHQKSGSIDTIASTSIGSDEDSKEVNLLFEKVSNKKSLNTKEYNSLSAYILKNNDESISENIGYLLFQYFQNDNKLSKEFVAFLKTKTDNDKERLLSAMIQLMCIDLSEENYTYEKLITDFKFYDQEVEIKKVFDECINISIK